MKAGEIAVGMALITALIAAAFMLKAECGNDGATAQVAGWRVAGCPLPAPVGWR
jgi:hypothetical protein